MFFFHRVNCLSDGSDDASGNFPISLEQQQEHSSSRSRSNEGDASHVGDPSTTLDDGL